MSKSFPGVITASDLETIELSFKKFLASPGVPLSQKTLYIAPTAAKAYLQVCDDGSSKRVYDEFPLGTTGHSFTKLFNQNVVAPLKKTLKKSEKTLGVFILGVGGCHREVTIVDHLRRELDGVKIRIFLVDISIDLLRVSCNKFGNLRAGSNLFFIQTDFEEGAHGIRAIRDAKIKDSPCVFLYLGNTFGNIDRGTFLGQLAAMMHPKDILFAEFLTGEKPKGGGIRDYEDKCYKPLNDIRTLFLSKTLAAFGLHPTREAFRKRCTQDTFGSNEIFYYKFTTNDKNRIGDLSPGNRTAGSYPDSIAMLKISKTYRAEAEKLLRGAFAKVHIEPLQYKGEGVHSQVEMSYAFCSRIRNAAGQPDYSVNKRGADSSHGSNVKYQLDIETKTLKYRDGIVSFSWVELAFLLCMLEFANAGTDSDKMFARFFHYIYTLIYTLKISDAKPNQVCERADNIIRGFDENGKKLDAVAQATAKTLLLSHAKGALKGKLKSSPAFEDLSILFKTNSLQIGFTRDVQPEFVITNPKGKVIFVPRTRKD